MKSQTIPTITPAVFRRALAPWPENRFTWVWALFYLAVGLLLISRHEMWRDELEVWLIARDTTLKALYAHLYTVSHPALWYLLVKGLLLFTSNPAAMQYLHLFIAAGSTVLILRYAPFARTDKVLLIFGYFFLYEYSVIARNCAPAVFLILATIVLYSQPAKNYRLILAALLILINTHVLGICFAFYYIILFAYDYWLFSEGKNRKKILYGLFFMIIFAAALGLAWNSLLPNGLSQFERMVRSPFTQRTPLAFNAQSLWSSYVPIPPFTLHFWNYNLVPTYFARILLSLLVLAGALFILWPSRRALLFYITGTVTLYAFFLLFHPGLLRHHGFLFIVFLVSYWIKRNENLQDTIPPLSKKRLLRMLLTGQCIAGLTAGILDILYPFSGSKQVGEFIKSNGLNRDMIIAGDYDYISQSVCAWLNQPLYYPTIKNYGSFIVWRNPQRKITTKTRQQREAYKKFVMQHLQELANAEQKKVLLAATYPLNHPLLASFPTAIQKDEVFYLYVFSPNSTARNLPLKHQ